MSWLYSRALAEASLPGCYLDGAASAPSSPTTSAVAYLSHDKTMEASTLSRYGTTCERLTEQDGAELLMLFRLASPVSSLVALPEAATSPPTYGPKSCELSTKSGRDSFSQRTSDLPKPPSEALVPILRPSDTACADRIPSGPIKSERRISAKDFGLLATPTATANQLAPSMAKWPGCRNLQAMSAATGLTLPTLYEWMMGWPIGWTDLRPLATGRFLEWQQQHGES